MAEAVPWSQPKRACFSVTGKAWQSISGEETPTSKYQKWRLYLQLFHVPRILLSPLKMEALCLNWLWFLNGKSRRWKVNVYALITSWWFHFKTHCGGLYRQKKKHETSVWTWLWKSRGGRDWSLLDKTTDRGGKQRGRAKWGLCSAAGWRAI